MKPTGMNPQDEKLMARRDAYVRRSAAASSVTYDLTSAISTTTKFANIIACYIPIRTEISPVKGMTALCEAGKTVCVPIIKGKAKPLEFRVWHPSTKMVVGEYGVSIPQDSETVVPDFVLAPLVAFDKFGMRLGYGGGFYDRTIANLRKSKHVPYVGVAFQEQQTHTPLPREITDIQLDAIITENGYHKF